MQQFHRSGYEYTYSTNTQSHTYAHIRVQVHFCTEKGVKKMKNR